MKKIIFLTICLFMLLVPIASADSLDNYPTNQEKAAYLLTLVQKYEILSQVSSDDSSSVGCKKIGDICIPYKDIYESLVAQYVYYANLK